MSRVIEVTFPGEKRVDAEVDGFQICTDQSERNGGGGAAPEPFTLFLSSLATCAGIYAVEFCRARKIDMTGMSLKMICDYDPDVKRYTRMTIALTLPQEFPEKYQSSIIRSMDLCTVKRHMIDPPEFSIEVH